MVTPQTVHRWVKVPNSIFVPCRASHLRLMQLHPSAQQVVDNLPNYSQQIDKMGDMGMGWAWIGDGRVLAMFGVALYWQGMAEAWLMVDQKSIQNRALQLTKGSRRFFDNIGPAIGLRRCQLMVSVAHKEAISWARLLGFEQEAVLRRYGVDGADHLVFARLYD
jgi:hypothetical protein